MSDGRPGGLSAVCIRNVLRFRLAPVEDVMSERVFPLDVGEEAGEERRVQQGSDQFMNETISEEEGMERKEGMHDFRN